jgi:hypothetical protein
MPRGGKREGAGRTKPPLGAKPRSVQIPLTDQQWEALKATDRISGTLRQLIETWMEAL